MNIALSLNEVAARTGLGRTTLYKAITAGELQARKIGKRTIVLNSDLETWISNLPVAQIGKATKSA
jgi:excisionase family DNA binding protein